MGQINDCNVQITTDEYTKQKTIETEYQTINNGKYKFTVDGNNIYMYLRLDQPSAFTVYKTDTLYMLFDDKEILKYSFIIPFYSKYNEYDEKFQVFVIVALTPKMFNKMGKVKITGIKLLFEYSFSEDSKNILIKDLSCIEKYLK